VGVCRACPEFVQATLTPVQTKSTSYNTLCQFLDLPEWSSRIHLEPELRSTFKTQLSYKKWQRYLHKALVWIAREKTYISPSGPKDWLFVILGLPVYPVLTPSGKTRYSTLKSSIAVPDSQGLLEHLKGKIEILDFGDLPVQEILPILKYARDPPTFLSTYDVQDGLQVTPTEPVFLDVFHSRLVGMKRTALSRYMTPGLVGVDRWQFLVLQMVSSGQRRLCICIQYSGFNLYRTSCRIKRNSLHP